MRLIIVESPVKGVTLKRFLGPKYKVRSSFGHIRDLPKDEFGVDVEHNFKPKYVIPLKSKKVIRDLKKEVKKAETQIIATDNDREGEAIAWHLVQALGLNEIKNQKSKIKNYQRIVFHEITKQAIQEALKNPRQIDMDLVNAQQARRILDRIVGYKLSPFLWKKIARGLSAGRVQSVTVRLVVEREREIENFVPQEYWTIEALLRKLKVKIGEFKALLVKKDGKTIPKLGIKTKKEADEIIQDLQGAEYEVEKVEKKEVKRNPLPPFNTSALQQEAWRRFKFPAKLTMRVAQQLYEKGFISYHRTDSLNLSNLSLFAARKFIIDNYGKEYWAGFLRKYKAKGRAQEAHEAIRPTFITKTPQDLKDKLDSRAFRLYDLIWRRFLACQMASASFDLTRVDIQAKNYTFKASGQVLRFDGFLKVYPIKFKEEQLSPLKKNEPLELLQLIPSQHFTQPPPRYTEATLIKTLEQNGIGRPSTYAPIISTIQERNYVAKDERKLFRPRDIGNIVTDLLVEHFSKIVDIKFTASMEEDLDKIAQGKEKWVPVVREFYEPFAQNLEKKYQEVSKKEITEKALPAGQSGTEKKCPNCGASLVIRLGKFGKFYACSKFPQCRFTENIAESIGVQCPKCQKGEIIERRSKKRKIFYGCSRYPQCDFALWDKPLNEKCPQCGSLLVSKNKTVKCSNKECMFKTRR